MNKLIIKLKAQTWYFKVVFAIATPLLITMVVWCGNAIIQDIAAANRHIPDSGLISYFAFFLIGVSLAVYTLVLYACSRKGWRGKVATGIILSWGFLEAVSEFAIYSSGVRK